jgi:hypothetical protein
MTQGCSFVPPLPPTPWTLTTQKDNKIHDVLEMYAYYYPEIHQIFQILPGEQETKFKVWTCSTKVCHNDPLESVMCRPSRPNILKAKDSSSIDFMCLTVIDPTTSCIKIVELPTVRVTVPKGGTGKKATCLDCTKDAEIFDKTSAQISKLVYKCWFRRYPSCQYMIYNNGSEFKLHFHAL